MKEQRLNQILRKYGLLNNKMLSAELLALLSEQSLVSLDSKETLLINITETVFHDLNYHDDTSSENDDRHIDEEINDTISSNSDCLAQDFQISPEKRRLGRYEDLGLLGLGGMGEVRKVHDPVLGRTLAMKIIHSHLIRQRGVVERFIEESQIAAQLQHPNILSVYELGVLADGRQFFTMQEILGQSLSELISEFHQQSKHRVFEQNEREITLYHLIDVLHDVCQAIAYAHSMKVLHRDLKPENVMIGSYGEVLVLDWGIAKVLNRVDETIGSDLVEVVSTDRSSSGRRTTRAGVVAGTPAYMSPEQARGEIDNLDQRTDIYSLGAMLYEILTGDAPYQGES